MEPPQPTPPPLPPAGQPPPVPYATPGIPSVHRREVPAQAVFDTVTGPNVRATNNLIQLACVAVGAAIGVVSCRLIVADPRAALPIGAVAGGFGALLISGVVIGVVRFVTTFRRR